MVGYCLARSFRGFLTPRHDIDLSNVTLYWHFAMATGLVTVATIAYFQRDLFPAELRCRCLAKPPASTVLGALSTTKIPPPPSAQRLRKSF